MFKFTAFATFKKELRGMSYDSVHVFEVMVDKKKLTIMIKPFNRKAEEVFQLFHLTSNSFRIRCEILIYGVKKSFDGTATLTSFTSKQSDYLIIERESDDSQFILAAATESATDFRNTFGSARNAQMEIVIS